MATAALVGVGLMLVGFALLATAGWPRRRALVAVPLSIEDTRRLFSPGFAASAVVASRPPAGDPRGGDLWMPRPT